MLVLQNTNRFQVLSMDASASVQAAQHDACNNEAPQQAQEQASASISSTNDDQQLPVLQLADLLLHAKRGTTRQMASKLMTALQRHAYCLLQFPRTSLPGAIVDNMRHVLHNELFASRHNAQHLEVSETVYVSETGVPMWKLGYERSEDGVREFFRIHGGRPDDQPWPHAARTRWLRGLALCRHICDEALGLCLDQAATDTSSAVPSVRKRPGRGRWTWKSDKYASTPINDIEERFGDFSVMYSMHYFNDVDVGSESKEERMSDPKENASAGANTVEASCEETDVDDASSSVRINVKQHVDPSLCVLEPYLCTDCPGLQVWDEHYRKWIDTDGPDSPVANLKRNMPDDDFMCLFVGRAFARHITSVKPTLHRVVAGPSGASRRSIIYEQKYEEFFE
mmetsp:Transcript_12118/g.33359  ORF Transcript_12118/g.33359 Transcript_12118/m.33359 type:complete len:396 (-) Transcript_12118:56-1243(-)